MVLMGLFLTDFEMGNGRAFWNGKMLNCKVNAENKSVMHYKIKSSDEKVYEETTNFVKQIFSNIGWKTQPFYGSNKSTKLNYFTQYTRLTYF